MSDGISQDDVETVLNYASMLQKNGWTAEAYRVCQIVVANGFPLDPVRCDEIVQAFSRLGPDENMGPHTPLVLMRDCQAFSSLHLTANPTEHQKKIAFKSGVGFINIETSSQCNRACPYCPNSIYDRRKDNTFFDWAVYERILDDLASIGYARRISLVGLNEPLMHVDDFLARLRMIREKLPNAYILIFTNGDYLTKDAFQALEAVGINELKVAMHLSKDKPYEERDILKRIFDKSRELSLTPILKGFVPNKQIDFQLLGSKTFIHMTQENYMTEGLNRGEVLKGVGKKMADRTAPCLQPFDNFIVNYLGDVLPCCATIGSSDEVRPYVVGNVKESSIFDIYCAEKMTGWRRHVMVEGPKRHPCATCSAMWPGFPENWAEIVAKAFEIADEIAKDPTHPSTP